MAGEVVRCNAFDQAVELRRECGAIQSRCAMTQPIGRVEMSHRRFVLLEIVKRLAEREV